MPDLFSKRLSKRPARRNRGVAVLMTALSTTLLLAAVGIAIDSTVAYSLKAKLSSAADAAAIAAARSLSVGMTLAEQEASAVARADAFFRANFAHSQWITPVPTTNVTVAETAARVRTVTVNVTAAAPQFFLKIFGFGPSTIRAMGRASRRDVNLIVILDRSYSMRDDVAPGRPCSTMKAASTNFVNMFAQGRDRLGLITYGSSWYLGFAPSTDFKSGGSSLTNKISQIGCDGNTSTAMALWQGYQQLVAINEPGSLNLIVIFTDGVPNGITADLPVKRRTDNRYGYGADGYSNVGTTYSMLPSTCKDGDGDSYDRNNGASAAQFSAPNWNPNWTPDTKRGVIAQWAGGTTTTGHTAGPMQLLAGSISQTSEPVIADKNGCRYGTNQQYLRRDIAYIPEQDIYGNNTTGYKPVLTFTGATHPYAGWKRPDSPSAVTYASINAADNAALRIRNDTTLEPVIYALGLGDVDHEFLRRISNDSTSPIFDPDKPEGVYVYAPSPTDLNYAFNRVASEILRIAR